MTPEHISSLLGTFTWATKKEGYVLIETDEGNFLWRDSECGGDGSISKYPGTYQDFLKEAGENGLSPELTWEIGDVIGEFTFVEE